MTTDTPDLYYICYYHPNMGGVVNVDTSAGTQISCGDVTITFDDNTHFDINQDIEFNAIAMV